MHLYKFITKIAICAGLIYPLTSAAQGPFVIGTINPGDSIIIIYDATINNPTTPANAATISNQGTVSGSNFANQVTNDPDSPSPNDPTITQLNAFPLPVTFTGFKAYQKLNDIELEWKVTESDIYKYEIERSADGRTFVKIGEVMATGRTGMLTYTFLDANPFAGSNFYRIKIIEVAATSKYTNIVKVSLGSTGSMLTIYPNPVREKMLNIEMKTLAKGTYTFTLYNNLGQKVFTKQIDHAGTPASEVIILPTAITKGIYHVQVSGKSVLMNKMMVIE